MQLRSRPSRPGAFTLMEVLVVIAIIVVISSIAYPIYTHFKMKGDRVAATNSFKKLSEGMISYANQSSGVLPTEDLDGKDSWTTAKLPTSDKVWYNAVLHFLQLKTVGEFASEGNPAAFYTKENILFLPGAQYPEKNKPRPLFALAMNSRLSRSPAEGVPAAPVKLEDIVKRDRTVMFLEQGLSGEPRAHESIAKKDYDGAPKGSAKSFVARYSGSGGKVGLLSFFDGHVEEVNASKLLTTTGAIAWSGETATDSSAFIWTTDPKVNPNQKRAEAPAPAPSK